MHASQVNSDKSSGSNKIIRHKFNEAFHFLSYLSKNLTASSFAVYFVSDKAKPSRKFAATLVFVVVKNKNKSQISRNFEPCN